MVKEGTLLSQDERVKVDAASLQRWNKFRSNDLKQMTSELFDVRKVEDLKTVGKKSRKR